MGYIFIVWNLKTSVYLNKNENQQLQVLNMSLKSFLKRFRHIDFIFQQDNAAFHNSRETRTWLEKEKINVMNWPACSPDLNPIENLWGIIVRRVYIENKQYKSADALKTAILETYNGIDDSTLKNLIGSMKKRIYQVINRLVTNAITKVKFLLLF